MPYGHVVACRARLADFNTYLNFSYTGQSSGIDRRTPPMPTAWHSLCSPLPLDKTRTLPSSDMSNREAIDVNNRGVKKAQNGDVYGAFKEMSKASNILANKFHFHTDKSEHRGPPIRFHWCDCCAALSKSIPTVFRRSTYEGTSTFLCFKFLVITLPSAEHGSNLGELDVENECSCNFSWAIWFK